MLCNLNSVSENQIIRSRNNFLNSIIKDNNSEFRIIAKELWFEAAMRGDLVAQSSLAAACMDDFMTYSKIEGDLSIEPNEPSCHQDRILIAAVLFAMAAQQNDEGSLEALSRVMNIHHSHFASDSTDESFDEDAFLNTPICQTIMVGANMS